MTKSVMQEGLLKPRNKARVLTIGGIITDGYCHGLINYIDIKAKCCQLKKFTYNGTLLQVFIRVYRLVIQSVMLEFSTQLWELLPLSLVSSPPSLRKY